MSSDGHDFPYGILAFFNTIGVWLSAGLFNAMNPVTQILAVWVVDPADAAVIVQERFARPISWARQIDTTRLDFYALTIIPDLVKDHSRGAWPMAPLYDALIRRAPICRREAVRTTAPCYAPRSIGCDAVPPGAKC